MRVYRENTHESTWRLIRAATLVLFVAALVGVALAQSRTHAARPEGPQSAPSEAIVRGTVVAAGPAALEVRDARGTLHRVAVDANTLVLSDDKDFSVANLPDIELAVRDLSKGDLVEVVVEPRGARAGIVTRISPIDATATARARQPR
jgi:hypothetical protein